MRKLFHMGLASLFPSRGDCLFPSPVWGEGQRVRGETKEDFKRKRNIPLTSVLSPEGRARRNSLSLGGRGIKGEGEIQDKTNKTTLVVESQHQSKLVSGLSGLNVSTE